MSKIVQLVDKKLFVIRWGDDRELGAFLYDQLKAMLDQVGKTVDSYSGLPDVQCYSYRESGEKTIEYEVSEEVAYLIEDFFNRALAQEIKAYGQRKRKEGTQVLFALNRGDLSAKDFEGQY